MKRTSSQNAADRPSRRPLKIFAFDPTLGRTANNRITIDVENEPLKPGPAGARIIVVDYDAPHRRYYPPVDLDDPNILMRGGLEPTESDPRFHQQMVYAVTMKTLENFDRALGRRLRFAGDRPLAVYPHGMIDANAFYDREMGLVFGYFRAEHEPGGQFVPGQRVFACLSHDIIAHEMTHAIIDRLKPHLLEPTNVDVGGFHEGFADIVAIFQHFTFPDILQSTIQHTRADLRSSGPMVELASEFGRATGSGSALRCAIDEPDPTVYATWEEPHDRGSILVAAVFDAFFNVFQSRIEDLVRIAGIGGEQGRAEAFFHPDLVNRVSREAGETAQSILTMCIRALEYLPPVDVTYGDFLRALVTADHELLGGVATLQRAAIIDAFRRRGIYPEGVVSLAEESLLWDAGGADDLPPLPSSLLGSMAISAADASRTRQGIPKYTNYAQALGVYAKKYATALGFDPNLPVQPSGFHSSFRVATDGQVLVELVAQFVQTVDKGENPDGAGVPLRAGTTVVCAADGVPRYVIKKPVAAARRERQLDFIAARDNKDPHLPWADDAYLKKRLGPRMNLAMMHRGRGGL